MSISKIKRFSHDEPFETKIMSFINYDKEKINKIPKRSYIKIAAFDPGVVNTGCRIEERYIQENKISSIVQSLLKSGDKSSSTHYFIVMRNHLLKIKDQLEDCDYILIESQMRTNPEACRMCQHIISTLLSILDEEKSRALIVELSPIIKSKTYDVKGIKGKELKKWAVDKATEILSERKDYIGLSMINDCKKKDDHCDAVLYCDAWYQILLNNNFFPQITKKMDDNNDFSE